MTDLDFLKRDEVKQFITSHLNSDIQELILNPPGAFKDQIKRIASQLQARQKAKGKLDSWVSNFDLIFPPGLSIEQASSEITADYKKKLINDTRLVDLTGGMGIDCLALSANFDEVTYVERNVDLCEVFKHNCKILERSIEVVQSEAQAFVKGLPKQPNTSFFIDPARRDDTKNKVFKLEDCTPNLHQLAPLMLKKASSILIKLSPLLDIKSIINDLPHVAEIHIVSVKNECKEVLVLLKPNFKYEPIIRAINLQSEEQEYTFKHTEESSTELTLGELADYLFEPNASILKAGAFKKVAIDFSLVKLHANTHLYTVNEPKPNLPGRLFKVIEKAHIDSDVLEKYAPEKLINVLTRNYPVRPDELKKKFKIRDGGDYFLIGFRDIKGKARLVVAEKV